jgi:predicted HicB family RNase H-like nuclease
MLLKSNKEGHSNNMENLLTDLDEDGSDRSRIMNADASPRRSFPLRLAKSLRETASTLARRDGISLNHFICLAVAEKISRLEPDGPALEAPARQSPHAHPDGCTKTPP